MKSYLSERFIQVVSGSCSSVSREIFSGVPQGAKWSPILWDVDISDVHLAVSQHARVVCYADDIGLWYEETDSVTGDLVDVINSDLRSIYEWGLGNLTTFDPGVADCCDKLL